MLGVDEAITGLADGRSLAFAIGVAVLLGLRHACDPDHVVAVSALVTTEADRPRRSTVLGLAWGAGHATTLGAFGVPALLVGRELGKGLASAVEVVVGLLILAVSVRLLVAWRRGVFDARRRGGGRGIRSPLGAYGIGLAHGAAGSSAIAVLLLAPLEDRSSAVLGLAAFALAAALAMALVSSSLGYVLARRWLRLRLDAVAPVLGMSSAAFGAWYAGSAIWS